MARVQDQRVIHGIAVSAGNLSFAAACLAAKDKLGLRATAKESVKKAAAAEKEAREVTADAVQRFRIAESIAALDAMKDGEGITEWADALKDVVPSKKGA